MPTQRARRATSPMPHAMPADLAPKPDAAPAVDAGQPCDPVDEASWPGSRSDPLDRLWHARQARLTGSLSHIGLALAWMDWGMHLANAPGRQLELAHKAASGWARLMAPNLWEAPAPHDRRFRDEGWSKPPFNAIAQAFLTTEDWWREATCGPPGVARAHGNVVAFSARQMLDVLSPSNLPWCNPEVIRATLAERGQNFVRGWQYLLEDLREQVHGHPEEKEPHFVVGRDLATTPGKVVLRNELMELIQYAPSTKQVRPEPILIVPAWIMKYYILDLSPHNSLIGWLVAQGFTVFCISWRNPGPDLRDMTLEDYHRRGVTAALDAVADIAGPQKVHACGYCLGGTLLSATAAALARDGHERLATLTLLAAQTDFTEAGELQLFTDASQLALLDDVMWRQGYLDSTQMAGAFQMLRSTDLIWSRMIKTYLLGERTTPNDLMAWNADATRMPYRMHSEYLHRMFLRNDLAEGRFPLDGEPVAIQGIHAPIFAVGTETDHVAPWHSVYKIHLLNPGEITFVLTSGGHNAGIVSEPGHPHRHYRLLRREPRGTYLAPEAWEAAAAQAEGSWWPAWADWLHQRSGPPADPPPLAPADRGHAALADAPGTYVLEH